MRNLVLLEKMKESGLEEKVESEPAYVCAAFYVIQSWKGALVGMHIGLNLFHQSANSR